MKLEIVVCALVAALAGTPAAAARGQDAEARRLFLNAQRLERDGDTAKALGEYAFLVQQFPGSEWADDALLQTALTELQSGNQEAARRTIDRLVDGYARTGSAAGGLFLRAEMLASGARTADEIGQARDALRRIPIAFPPRSFPALAWRGQAKASAGELSLLLGEEAEAAATLIDAIENEPRTEATARALFAFSVLLGRQADWAAATQALQEIRGDFDPTSAETATGWVAAAGRRLSLIHRTVIRPARREPPWTHGFPRTTRGVTLDRPTGIAADSAGRLIVADEGGDFVVLLAADGTVLARRGLQDPRRPWFSRTGVAMAATESSVTALETMNSSPLSARGGRNPGPLQKIFAVESGLFGGLYVLDEDSRRMLVFDADLNHIATPLENGRVEPADVARDTRGRLYVLDGKDKAVLRYSQDGRLDRKIIAGAWKDPVALAIDELDNIYVLDRGDKIVDVFSSDGRKLATLGPRVPGGFALRNARDLAVDGSGRLYIADRDEDVILVFE